MNLKCWRIFKSMIRDKVFHWSMTIIFTYKKWSWNLIVITKDKAELFLQALLHYTRKDNIPTRGSSKKVKELLIVISKWDSDSSVATVNKGTSALATAIWKGKDFLTESSPVFTLLLSSFKATIHSRDDRSYKSSEVYRKPNCSR